MACLTRCRVTWLIVKTCIRSHFQSFFTIIFVPIVMSLLSFQWISIVQFLMDSKQIWIYDVFVLWMLILQILFYLIGVLNHARVWCTIHYLVLVLVFLELLKISQLIHIENICMRYTSSPSKIILLCCFWRTIAQSFLNLLVDIANLLLDIVFLAYFSAIIFLMRDWKIWLLVDWRFLWNKLRLLVGWRLLRGSDRLLPIIFELSIDAALISVAKVANGGLIRVPVSLTITPFTHWAMGSVVRLTSLWIS